MRSRVSRASAAVVTRKTVAPKYVECYTDYVERSSSTSGGGLTGRWWHGWWHDGGALHRANEDQTGREPDRTQPDDFLGNFSVADHPRLRAVARLSELQPGDCLFDQGSVATAAFVLTGGQAELIVRGQPVGEIAAGAIVGDADVLGRHPYRCRVEARTPVTAWQIDAADLDRLLVDAPTFARALARDLGRRLRAAELSLATG